MDPFFSLKRFAHKALWKEGEPVWSPLAALSKYLSEKKSWQIEIAIPKGVFLERPEEIAIGKGTIIEPGVYIQGPCVIGEGCVIRHGAYLRDGVICGDHCQIGHSSEIKHSILLDYACATHFVYVGDSILGNEVNLGAGVKCANLRLDRRDVSVWVEGERVKTGLRKFGCIVGDRVQIGCNSVLNPGTLVGMESVSHPLMNLSGSIPPRSQVTREGVKPIEPQILEKLLWQSKTIALA
ncbi:MAG TPA: LpxA family transferase [Chlamydiales bacterium]|nr:LpxA family transferase [Chlamydiales bacterium]